MSIKPAERERRVAWTALENNLANLETKKCTLLTWLDSNENDSLFAGSQMYRSFLKVLTTKLELLKTEKESEGFTIDAYVTHFLSEIRTDLNHIEGILKQAFNIRDNGEKKKQEPS